MTWRKGDRVKVKGRRGIHTVHSQFQHNATSVQAGWWCVVPDGGKFIPARPEDLRSA